MLKGLMFSMIVKYLGFDIKKSIFYDFIFIVRKFIKGYVFIFKCYCNYCC